MSDHVIDSSKMVEPDHTAAVIEAARLVLAHVDADILVDRVTGAAFLEVSVTVAGRQLRDLFAETDDALPNTFSGALAMLRGAIDAYDEAETESETP